MEALIENINKILSEWDPIGVGTTVATSEYKGYIPIILQNVNNTNLLEKCLENILVNQMELDYDAANESHINELQQVCNNIIQAYEKNTLP
jgi:hypothetical protein